MSVRTIKFGVSCFDNLWYAVAKVYWDGQLQQWLDQDGYLTEGEAELVSKAMAAEFEKRLNERTPT